MPFFFQSRENGCKDHLGFFVLQDIVCNHIMSPLVERYPTTLQRCMLDLQQTINRQRIGKLQMVTSFAHELDVHNRADFFWEGRVQHTTQLGPIRPRSFHMHQRDPSSHCTSVNTRFLSLSQKESETTLLEIWGEVVGGLMGVAKEPPLCVKSGVARRSAITLSSCVFPIST